ncbi:exoglucanase-like protein 1 precursor [Mycena leptocephala]|nr:exoglucanase-like protein 1 precursor [Mycena leptocephala]
MSRSSLLVIAALLPAALSQLAGTNTAEVHPTLTWQKCTGTGGTSCTTQSSSVVLDSNWRWLHDGVSGDTNCYTGNTWDTTFCPDGKTCAANCALDGADYSGTYGISSSGAALTLKFVTGSNVGSRVYLLAPGSTTEYQTFNFENQEFVNMSLNGHRFDVDVSQLPCGLNGALYFSQMDADGGVAKSAGTNKAGAKFGTGYCDSQCPRDMKFINGVANVAGWTPDSNNGTSDFHPDFNGADMSTCCPEMDVWEANSISAAFTPHPCSMLGQSTCTGTTCSEANSTQGTCDQAGCDFNSYRMGNTTFYGPGLTVDTKQKMTVVTQFVGSPITSIRRFYVQNGKVIPNSNSNIAGNSPRVTGNSISDSFCAAQKTAFGDTNTFASKGGLAGMSEAAAAGMVLVMSIWDDYAAEMLWLDAPYPPPKRPPLPVRGTCSASSGVPSQVESASPNAQVIYSNIKFGPIGSTFAEPA